MSEKYYKLIKSLREEKNLTQQQVADKIGVSRTSYISFEKGKIDISFSQMIKLSEFFGISLEDVEEGLKPDYKKYKEMILACIRKCSDEIPKTKLAKLLYLADFAWYYSHLESMSGMKYRRLQYGPVSDVYFRAIDEMEENGEIEIKRKGDAILISETRGGKRQELENLSKKELKLIEDISKKWKDKRTSEIVKFTHNQIPYKICSPDEIIPYELITQEDPDHVY